MLMLGMLDLGDSFKEIWVEVNIRMLQIFGNKDEDSIIDKVNRKTWQFIKYKYAKKKASRDPSPRHPRTSPPPSTPWFSTQ